MTDAAPVLRLLAWLSPAFPTGGFAWSHGIEWAIEAGDITDARTLRDWIELLLRHGAGRNDAILLRHAHRAARDPEALRQIVDLARATAMGRERLAESVGQGNAFALAAAAWPLPVLTDLTATAGDLPYAVAVGAQAGAAGIDEDLTAAAVLQAFAAQLISAAVRLVPLGQSAGLAVLASLEPTITDVVRETRDATPEDLGGACFRSDIAAMRHETQYTRLFRS